MVELLVNKYKYSRDDAETTLPCLRRRTRRRESIQCTHNASPPMSAVDYMNDSAPPNCDTYAQSQVSQEKKTEPRCYCV